MAFSLPNFNLTANVWTDTGSAPVGAPRISPVCNLAFGRRSQAGNEAAIDTVMYLLVPKLTDIRGVHNAPGFDCVEVPAGSGRFYSVNCVDDAGKGFANEHRVALLAASYTWPTPIP